VETRLTVPLPIPEETRKRTLDWGIFEFVAASRAEFPWYGYDDGESQLAEAISARK
jgi:hypothetical protein